MDFMLTAEQQHLREVARNFALTEVRPAARAMEREQDPSRWCPAELVKRASQLGLRLLSLPKEYGGRDAGCLTQVVVLEQLCFGDVGFGLALMHCWREGRVLADIGTDYQKDHFLAELVADDSFLPGWCITEPDFGSDNDLGYAGSLADGPTTSAVRDGDDWVINGTKCYITNASVAKLFIVGARTDQTVTWKRGQSLFLVPAGTPGLEPGPPQHELGARLRMGGTVEFRDCRVPQRNLLGPLNTVRDLHVGRGNKVKEAAKALGVGQAAYEIALHYAKKRIQGGTRLIEHQLIGGSLADMAIELEQARTFIWRAAWTIDQRLPEADGLEDMAKVATTETVMSVATRAIQIWGHAGALTENPIEKLLRDAAVMLLPPIGNSALRSKIAGKLDRIDVAGNDTDGKSQAGYENSRGTHATQGEAL
jgi:alkylation response protein AidB-like acyl-CoA dehydrogenase